MSIKDLKKELEKVQDEKEKDKIIRDYSEKKFIGCGRIFIWIIILLTILSMLCGFIALLKFLLTYIF